MGRWVGQFYRRQGGQFSWLSEGLGTLFEAPVFGDDGKIHGAPRNWRDEDDLRPAFASASERKLLHVEALFGMSPRTLLEGEDRAGGAKAARIEEVHYALVRSVCAWLDEKGKLWPFYRTSLPYPVVTT